MTGTAPATENLWSADMSSGNPTAQTRPNSGPARYFWGLDLIRFGSALMVVLFHFVAFGGDAPLWPAEPGDAPFSWLAPIAWMGWVGVQIFFVLSGFVIAASARGSNAGTFLRKRAIRLLPALRIAATIALIARLLWGEPLQLLLPAFLKTLVLSPKGPYIDGVVWTLVVEAAFYLGTTAAILVAPWFGGTQRTLRTYALLLAGASAVFTVVFWASLGASQTLAASGLADRLSSFMFDVSLLRHGVFFALGMLMYEAVQVGAERRDAALMIGISLICMLQIGNQVPDDRAALAPVMIWASAAALIFFGAKYGDRLIKTDVRHIMRPIGLMTYPLYLNHFILGQSLLPVFGWWISNSAVLAAVLLAVLLANAWIMAQYPERMIQSRLKKVMLKDKPPRPLQDAKAVG